MYFIWVEAIMVSLIQHFEADFLWKVSLKILNSGIILKTFTHDIMGVMGRENLRTIRSCSAHLTLCHKNVDDHSIRYQPRILI